MIFKKKIFKEENTINTKIVTKIAESGIFVGIALLIYTIWIYTFGILMRLIFPEGWNPNFIIVIFPLIIRRNGIFIGACASFAYRFLSFWISSGAVIIAINPYSLLLDYLVNGPIGLYIAWLLTFKIKKNNKLRIILFTCIFSIIAFIASFWSGVFFYGTYTYPGLTIYTYSLLYNFSASLAGLIMFFITFYPTQNSFYKVNYYKNYNMKFDKKQ